jgi:hypothetical protein
MSAADAPPSPPADMFGRVLVVGDTLAKPQHSGAATARILLAKVTQISGHKVYLDDAKRPIAYPALCIVLNDLPHLPRPAAEAAAR